MNRFLAIVVLVSMGCRSDPLEKPLSVLDSEGCTAAMPLLQEVAIRPDAPGIAARALLADCRLDAALADPDSSMPRLEQVASVAHASLDECAGLDLPDGVEGVDARRFGSLIERMAEAALDRGEPGAALGLIDGHSRVAIYSDDIHAIEGVAHLRLQEWSEAAVDLETAGALEGQPAADRADALRLASGAWKHAGQKEKALADFSRAENLSSLELEYPERLIEEGREIEYVLGELIAASVHGVLVTTFERDWDALQDEPQAFNFFFDKRDKDFLEAADEIDELEQVIAQGDIGQFASSAPVFLYQILNMRGLNHAAGGDFEAARKDLERAIELVEISPEAEANLELLSFWIADQPAP